MSDDTVQLRAWWIPQVPMQAFRYDVPTIAAGQMLLDALAKYDAFQYEHNVKPDYCNVGGLEWQHAEHTEGEWWSFDPDAEDEAAEVVLAGGLR